MEKHVTIINTTAAGWWLPAVDLTPALLLKPGTNRVPAAHFEAVRGHPSVIKGLTRTKMIRLATSEEDAAEHTLAVTKNETLKGLPVSKALPLIADERDGDRLIAWAEADDRKTVKEAIDKRLEELAAAETDDDDVVADEGDEGDDT